MRSIHLGKILRAAVWGVLPAITLTFALPTSVEAMDVAAVQSRMAEDIFRFLEKQEEKKSDGEDTVRLTSGAVMTGTVLEETDDYIRFERKGGIKTTIKREKIASIERGGGSDAPIDESALRAQAAEAAEALTTRLQTTVSFDFEQTRLVLICEFTSRITGLQVMATGRTRNARINIKVKDAPLYDVMVTMAGQANGRLVGRPDGLIVVPN